MFRLRNSEGLVRSLYQQTLYHPNHNNLMAYLACYDPSSQLSKAFSHYPSIISPSDRGSYLSFPFLQNLVYANVFGISRSTGLGPKGCSFDTSGGRFIVRANERPRGFASHRRNPMLADLEQGNSVRGGDECDATLTKVDNGSLNGSPIKPLSFRDHRFSEKLVVAVDVDEGMYAAVCNCICMCHPFFKILACLHGSKCFII